MIENLLALITLAALEIALGIDNIVFITVVTSRLPADRQPAARKLGLALAMISRLALLATMSWLVGLSTPLFHVFQHGFTGRDLALLGGGVFLLFKAVAEIHHKMEEAGSIEGDPRPTTSFASVVAQIFVLDVVFSLDSVIAAVGMSGNFWVMAAAIVIAVLVMLVFSTPVANFVTRHPSVQMLAFAFLLLIGVFLLAEGMGQHIERGYIYFAMFFSLFVEVLNLRLRSKRAKAATSASPQP